ncbi:MAG: helix-turn-helix domain-containing protein [Clostridia bacterium]|nr:helix-turn-helix domain-containing protein [Clostridia bacterium]
MKFCENLYALRKNMNISQEQLAELVDVSRQSVSKWELGESYPTIENIFKLCNVLNCKMNELINEKLTDFELMSNEVKSIKQGYERFLGYADTYDEGRPKLPSKAIDIIKMYLDRSIDTIVDLGSGTGLSTETCTSYANNVIGVEPSKDMIKKARTKENKKMHFISGFGEKTGLENEIADIVICSQAFHWMEPNTTIKEVYRILKKGGVFAVVDADYPPIINKELEQLNSYILRKTARLEDYDSKWLSKKNEHLNNIRKSGLFDYSREICFEHIEKYDQERYKKFLLSQSSMQHAIKYNYNLIIDELDTLDEKLNRIFKGKDLNALYSYRMRIGIK